MFFEYRQNNSGGRFHEPAISVIVEAADASEADDRARDHGVYFNGCDSGTDCSCCGDRWYTAWGDGDPVPSVYGEPISESEYIGSAIGNDGHPAALIVYTDGHTETIQESRRG